MPAAVDLLAELGRQEQQVRTLRAAYAAVMARDGATFWIAEAARELRAKNDTLMVDVASRLRASEPKISRFERHKSFPEDIDDVITAYARELKMDAIDIWRHALELWEQGELAATPDEEPEVSGIAARLEEKAASPPKRVVGQSRNRVAGVRRTRA